MKENEINYERLRQLANDCLTVLGLVVLLAVSVP